MGFRKDIRGIPIIAILFRFAIDRFTEVPVYDYAA